MDHGSRRAIIAAFLANLGIALSKLIAFVLTGAASMLAEAIHSFADTGNQGLLMLGGARRGGRPTMRTRSATGRCATSGPSSSRSCCSASAGCSRSSKASRSSCIRT